ncbi:GNAT family N-acetyltransferase [Aquibacillus rhizosphaerae]|uniref:GNAT family N-acetyltransferase n=1 Tax=Aquibacillus rhizosphaerae TaxID=3051431 RepID=A0ABT7L901_9BACI|nr:GNAT family N-acetyltransferase [Aquibacillus sp. LR5S19]MDL4842333.1 GNAT family N-acetyltransferase [Aquibacillus sp. LR5S19]
MNEFIFIKDYRNDEILRTSFNELSNLVFEIDFEGWFQNGFWNNLYIPYSFIERSKVVANVSVNILDLVINGEIKKAIQIGTVMTHPDYRKKGLSSLLLKKVLNDYGDEYEFIYLFANQTVLDFYPKFGFESVDQYQCSMDFLPSQSESPNVRKLDSNNKKDLDLIYKFASERSPVSKLFGTKNTHGILLFYCMHVYHNDLYYLDDMDVIVIYKKNDSQIDIFDIISKQEVNFDKILSKITDHETNNIVFHYTPDYKGINTKSSLINGSDTLFLKTISKNEFPFQSRHPLIAQA